MKRKDLYGLLEGFESVKDLKGVKFAYARAKNKKLVLNELELLKDSAKNSDKFLEYDKKRVELCKRYSKKDGKNNPIIENNIFIGLEGNIKFEKELKILREEFKEIIDEKIKQSEEFEKMLDEDIELEFHKVRLEDISADITGVQLELIEPILEEKI